MSEVSKYTVPEEGLKVAMAAVEAGITERRGLFPREAGRVALEAFIRWQSENPKVFSDEWIVQLVKEAGCADLLGANQFVLGMHQILDLFQRRMYLAPEPEVPEEIKDLLYNKYAISPPFERHNNLVIEAYRRGKASK